MTRSLWLLLLTSGCIFGDAPKDDSTPSTGTGTGTGTSPGPGTGGGTGGATGTGTGTGTTPVDPAVAMCARWNADRVDMSEGAWTGSVGSCAPGTTGQSGIDNTLKLVNLYRFVAGLPPVVDDAGKNTSAQACALILDANNALSHSPPSDWDCWTQLGDDSAGRSNIATTPAVASIDLYMVDYGNADTLGHRRWILSNSLGPIGVGSTSDYSCLEVIGGSGNAGADWSAFPSPGPFPLDAMALGGWASADDEGWHVQSDSIDLNSATVTVSRLGQDLPVIVDHLPGGYGSSYAVSFIPNGWSSEPGVYQISVQGAAVPIDYEVRMVDCGAP